jgi:transposase
MLFGTANLRLFLYREPTDMRKGFDGLSGVVKSAMQHNPMSGDGYIFINRRRDRMKLLIWEHTGFVLYYKLLEQGTFELPQIAKEATSAELTWDELVMLTEGIELTSIKRRPRFHRPPKSALMPPEKNHIF